MARIYVAYIMNGIDIDSRVKSAYFDIYKSKEMV